MKSNFEYIDIFSGCGGLCLGMHNSSWHPIFCVEKNKDAFDTLFANLFSNAKASNSKWPDWLPMQAHDIDEIISKYEVELQGLRKKIFLIAGGPPCQGFSSAGRRDEKDSRNKLIYSYLKFIDLVEPETIFFENVKGFTMKFQSKNNTGKNYADYIVEELKNRNYRVAYHIIDFSDFGIPQKRARFILFASKNKDPELFYKHLYNGINKFLKKKCLNKTVSVKNAIADLEMKNGTYKGKEFSRFLFGKYGETTSPFQIFCRKKNQVLSLPDSHRFPNHRKNTVKKFTKLQELNIRNSNLSKILKEEHSINKNCLCVLNPDLPSPTLTTNPDDYIHYSEPRTLTVREYARLQTFPDWYVFKGNYTTGGDKRKYEVPRYTQIGNAIPPLFSEQVGVALKKFFKYYYNSGD